MNPLSGDMYLDPAKANLWRSVPCNRKRVTHIRKTWTDLVSVLHKKWRQTILPSKNLSLYEGHLINAMEKETHGVWEPKERISRLYFLGLEMVWFEKTFQMTCHLMCTIMNRLFIHLSAYPRIIKSWLGLNLIGMLNKLLILVCFFSHQC